MDENIVKFVENSPVTASDLPYINKSLRMGRTVEIRPPGNDGIPKIMEVNRKFLNTGREMGRPKSGKEL